MDTKHNETERLQGEPTITRSGSEFTLVCRAGMPRPIGDVFLLL